jgi:glycine/D-amino acid oxidase-like deaminating enzyme
VSSDTAYDAIVVGAGIVGAACAAALARDGRRVLVLDGAYASGGTTAAGMGHLVAMDDSPEQLALTAYSARLWSELAATLPRNAEYQRCGTIWVAEDDEQLAVVRDKQRVYAQIGIASEVLDAGGLAEAEPFLRAGLAGGLLVPSDAVVYQPLATLHLVREAQERGATVRERCRVESVVPHGVLLTTGEALMADVVVNAAGAEAALLTPELPVVPRKGHLVITDRHPELCAHQLVELGYLKSAHTMTTESVAFNLQPRATGQVLIGSSRELVGWDASINPRIVRRMLQRASDFMPALANASILRTWTGFRPATPDKLPLIGPWERVPGLWIAAGHEGLGITSALGTAQLLADLIAGRAPAMDPSAFAPARVLAAEGAEVAA